MLEGSDAGEGDDDCRWVSERRLAEQARLTGFGDHEEDVGDVDDPAGLFERASRDRGVRRGAVYAR